ncbi:MAG: hypothetical protein MJZ81_07665 [Bacteroidales bacterium]|nr:hypothetical protein [Bacteroidales bacterium]
MITVRTTGEATMKNNNIKYVDLVTGKVVTADKVYWRMGMAFTGDQHVCEELDVEKVFSTRAHELNENMINGEYISASEIEAAMHNTVEIAKRLGFDDMMCDVDKHDVYLIRHRDGRAY